MKLACAVLCLALLGCRKPPPPDAAEASYRRAVELFAKASAETRDLSYRDSRFDAVLEALAEVPAGDELRPKAEELARQIRTARLAADALDRESQQGLDSALAEPGFVPLPRDAPMPQHGKAGGTGAAGGTAGPADVSWGAGWSGRPKAAGAAGLPEWYRRAGYLGLGRGAAAPAAGAPAEAAAPPTAAPAAPPPAATPPSRSGSPAASPPPDGPPPVFGLPGPAGRALLGRP